MEREVFDGIREYNIFAWPSMSQGTAKKATLKRVGPSSKNSGGESGALEFNDPGLHLKWVLLQ